MKQQVKGVRRRAAASSPTTADDVLFGRITPTRPPGPARSYRNEGTFNGFACEFFTSEPDIDSIEEAQERGLLHREDGPAFVVRVDGSTETEAWYLNGQLHRQDNPAITRYFPNGMPRAEEWYLEGEKHREDDPAEITYDEIAASEGQRVVEDEVWWTHGQMDDLVEWVAEVDELLERAYQDADGRLAFKDDEPS